MKHLKTFESFNTNTNINEEIDFLKSKITKAKDKFILDNKVEFDALEIAEKELDSKNPDTQKTLADIQKSLIDKLKTFTGKPLFELLGIKPDSKGVYAYDDNWKSVKKDINDKITNINPYDKRTGIEKFGTGMGNWKKG